MKNFLLKKCLVKDSFQIISKKRKDKRGMFEKLYDLNFLKKKGNIKKINNLEINYVCSKKKGTLRGFHLQKKPFEETKIIYCIKGKIFDVVIDLRKDSKTYLKKQSIVLKPLTFGLIIPKGCAHAYQTMDNNSEVLYLSDNKYNKSSEIVLNPLQKNFGINWPIYKKIISRKDKNGEAFSILIK